MSKVWAKFNNFLMFSLLLPFVYGCNGGGGGSDAPLGALFTDEPATTVTETLLADGGETLATIHNPEPATMLLVGGGMLAMGYMKSRTKKQL